MYKNLVPGYKTCYVNDTKLKENRGKKYEFV